MVKSLIGGFKWLSSFDVHPAGDNVVCAALDRRLSWLPPHSARPPHHHHHDRRPIPPTLPFLFPLFPISARLAGPRAGPGRAAWIRAAHGGCAPGAQGVGAATLSAAAGGQEAAESAGGRRRRPKRG